MKVTTASQLMQRLFACQRLWTVCRVCSTSYPSSSWVTIWRWRMDAMLISLAICESPFFLSPTHSDILPGPSLWLSNKRSYPSLDRGIINFFLLSSYRTPLFSSPSLIFVRRSKYNGQYKSYWHVVLQCTSSVLGRHSCHLFHGLSRLVSLLELVNLELSLSLRCWSWDDVSSLEFLEWVCIGFSNFGPSMFACVGSA